MAFPAVRTSLDEIPQLQPVLRGEMSLLLLPLVVEYGKRLPEDWAKVRLKLPGLDGTSLQRRGE